MRLFPTPGNDIVQNRTMARRVRRRWAILLRRGAMMRVPVVRSDLQDCDGLRLRNSILQPGASPQLPDVLACGRRSRVGRVEDEQKVESGK